MNCLEARKEFPGFWRRTMFPSERASLVEHLGECTDCDRSFRMFALTAPVLHSEVAADASLALTHPPLSLVRPRRFVSGTRLERSERRVSERPWKIAAAAALMLITGGFSAWSSERWPAQNFTESVAGDSAEVDPATYSADSASILADASAPDSSLLDSIASDPSASGDDGV